MATLVTSGSDARCASGARPPWHPLRRLCGRAELAGETGALRQSPPSFAAAELPRYLGAGGQGAVGTAVGQRPLPGLPLQPPAAVCHWTAIGGPGYGGHHVGQQWRGGFGLRFLCQPVGWLRYVWLGLNTSARCAGLPYLPHQQLMVDFTGLLKINICLDLLFHVADMPAT